MQLGAENAAWSRERELGESQTQLQETVDELRGARIEASELRRVLEGKEARLEELSEELVLKDSELQRRADQDMRQRKAMELDRSQWMESAWEAREQRLSEQLDKLKLENHKDQGRTELGELQLSLRTVTEELHNSEEVVGNSGGRTRV